MMEEDGIVIKQSDFRLVEEFTRHIEEVFGVALVVQEVAHVPGDVIAGQRPAWKAVRVLPGPQETHLPGRVAKAKAYILSLTCAEAKRCQHRERYCTQAYQLLLLHQNDIERDSQAVLSFNQDGETLFIWGQDANVTMAKELVERRLCQLTPQTESLVVSVKPPIGGEEDEERVLHTLHSQSLSPGAESNHDSCYDSDTSPVCSRRNSSCNYLDAGHEDVSRTVSDTLAAEHTDTDEPDASLKSRLQADKDIIEGLSTAGQSESPYGHVSLQSGTKGEVGEESSTLSAEDYASKVEFAVKLGYTENQLQSALRKLGPEVNQNELLSELINLDKSEEEGHVGEKGDYGGIVEGIECLGLRVSGTDSSVDAMGSSSSTNTCGASDNLRKVVIDGSNVAMSHGNKEVFSCQGIRIAVEWFRQRGHQDITVFVPQWRKEASRPDTPIVDQEILLELEKEKILVFTPARRVGGKRVVCYDDRYIIKLAAETSGIVVSNDNYRDLINESSEFKRVIEERLLMYSFVNDRFMPPDDPLGRRGPSLDNFLCRQPTVPEPLPPVCPYSKKCTYGNKCKYYHPERGLQPQKSVTEKLAEKAEKNRKLQEVKDRGSRQRDTSPGTVPAIKVSSDSPPYRKTLLSKTKSLVTAPAPKTPLGRTKSLAPGTKLLNSQQVAGCKDSRQDAEFLSGAKDLKDSMSPNVKVTVSSSSMVAADSDKYRSYDDKLTEHRRKIERIESEKCLMQNSRHQQQRNNERKHSLKIPNQWPPLPHETLRPTHSDPYSLFSENSVLNSGHLALAKKLSDEGTADHENFGISLQSMVTCLDSAEKPMPLPIGTPPQQAPGAEKKHRKLARQLSLKGSEDPRWQQQQQSAHAVHATVSFPSMHSNIPRSSKYQADWMDAYRPGEQDRVAPHVSAYPTDPRPLSQPLPAHQSLGRKFSYGDPLLCGSGTPGAMDHSSVSRMASAPVTYTSKHSNQMLPTQASMNRQNSTSDPQLHKQLDGPTVSLPFAPRAFTEGQAGDFFTPWSQQKSNPCNTFLEPAQGLPFESYCQTPPQGYPTPIGHRSSISGPADGLFGRHRSQETGGLDSPVRGTDCPRTPSPAPPLSLQTSTTPGDSFGQQNIMRRPPSTPEISLAKGFHSSKVNAPFQPSDSRYKLYYHLCGLFAEAKVRRVLNERPNETDPNVLCSLIIRCPDC